jgi:hypothetical protein
MAVIPHPPYSPDLAPCDFFLFQKMKLPRVLDTLTEKDFQEAFQKWRRPWEGTTWRVMAADRPYGEFYDFYSVSP